MILAALASFAALLIAWIVAPSEPVRRTKDAAPVEIGQAEPMAEAA